MKIEGVYALPFNGGGVVLLHIFGKKGVRKGISTTKQGLHRNISV